MRTHERWKRRGPSGRSERSERFAHFYEEDERVRDDALTPSRPVQGGFPLDEPGESADPGSGPPVKR